MFYSDDIWQNLSGKQDGTAFNIFRICNYFLSTYPVQNMDMFGINYFGNQEPNCELRLVRFLNSWVCGELFSLTEIRPPVSILTWTISVWRRKPHFSAFKHQFVLAKLLPAWVLPLRELTRLWKPEKQHGNEQQRVTEIRSPVSILTWSISVWRLHFNVQFSSGTKDSSHTQNTITSVQLLALKYH